MSAPYVERWSEQAACRDQPLKKFFTHNPDRAQAICRGCPVRAECLHDALTHNTPNGVWGGLLPGERREIRPLAASKAEAIRTLRVVLEQHDARTPALQPPPLGRTPMPTVPKPTPAPAAKPMPASGSQTASTVGQLLAWGDAHPDIDVQDQAARVRAGLAGLRQRHATDQELTAITTEAEQLEQRLAELRAREAELAPPKKTKTTKKTAVQRGYEPATVRAWAKENGVACPASGRVPKAVVDAWRKAQAQ